MMDEQDFRLLDHKDRHSKIDLVVNVRHRVFPSTLSSTPHLTRAGRKRELFLPVREQTAGGARQDEDGQHPGQTRTERQDQYPCVVACLGPDETPEGWSEGHAHTIPD